MLHSIAPHTTSSESAFAWVKELLARRGRAIIASDRPMGQIETEHAIFHIIEQDAAPDLGMLFSAFTETVTKNKNFVIIAPNLPVEAANSIEKQRLPAVAAHYHRKHVFATKVVLATTETKIKRAVNEMTHVNKVLVIYGNMCKLEAKYWLYLTVPGAAMIEDIFNAPKIVQTATLGLLSPLFLGNLLWWIAARWRSLAIRLGVVKLQR